MFCWNSTFSSKCCWNGICCKKNGISWGTSFLFRMLLEDYSEYHMFLICVRKTLINETQKGHPLYWIVVGCVAAPYFKLLFFLRHEINLNRKMIYVKSPLSFFFIGSGKSCQGNWIERSSGPSLVPKPKSQNEENAKERKTWQRRLKERQ